MFNLYLLLVFGYTFIIFGAATQNVAPLVGANVPALHDSHDALPYLFVALPVSHGKHEEYGASLAKYLPGWHGKHFRP